MRIPLNHQSDHSLTPYYCSRTLLLRYECLQAPFCVYSMDILCLIPSAQTFPLMKIGCGKLLCVSHTQRNQIATWDLCDGLLDKHIYLYENRMSRWCAVFIYLCISRICVILPTGEPIFIAKSNTKGRRCMRLCQWQTLKRHSKTWEKKPMDSMFNVHNVEISLKKAV